MNRFLAVLVAALVVVVASADVKVGYIDSGRIFQEYEGMESVRKQLSQDQTEWESTAEEMLRELEDLRSELETQRPMLTADALKDKESQIRSKQRAYEEYLQQIWGPDGQAAQKNVELTRPVVDKVNSVLEELAEADGYSMIFDIAEGSVVYARDGLDLTDLVLDELNKEFAPVAGEEEEQEEIKIAIFPFAENTLAEEDKSADRVYQSLYTLIDQSVRYEAIPRQRIDNLVAGMGLERERSIPQDRAIEIAQSAGAKVLLIGEVNKTIVHLEVTAKLVDADAGVVLLSETRKAEGETEEAFQTMMSDIASAVIQRYRP